MPLYDGGNKTLILIGVFLFIGSLCVVVPQHSWFVVMFLPAIFATLLDRAGRSALIVLAPALLGLYPPYAIAALVYLGVLLVGFLIHHAVVRGDVARAVWLPALLLVAVFAAAILKAAEGVALGVFVEDLVVRFADALFMTDQAAVDPGGVVGLRIQQEQLQRQMVRFFPSLIASSAISYAWINLLLFTGNRPGIRLRKWQSPDWVVWIFIAAGLTAVMPWKYQIWGINGVLIISHLYFFQGLAIISTYVNERRWPILLKSLLYIMILLQLYIVVSLIGLFDTWFNFRDKIGKKEGEIR